MSLTNIDHVVVLMLENRSFDSLLGWLYDKSSPALNIPAATGKDLYRGLQNLDLASFTNTALEGRLSSPPLRGAAGFTVPSVDPGEEFQHVNMQLFESAAPQPGDPVTLKGYLADFVAVMKARGFDDAAVQLRASEVMQSYTPGQLPVLNQLARHYAVSDAWFASVPSQTNGNRAFSLCGTSNGLVNNGELEPDPRAKLLEQVIGMNIGDDRFDRDTIFNALGAAGIDWAVFWQTSYLPHKLATLIRNLPKLIAVVTVLNQPLGIALAALLTKLLPYAQYLSELSSGELGSCYTWRLFPRISQIPDAARHFQGMEEFHRRARAGALPKFSYLEPFWTIAEKTVDQGSKQLFTAIGNDYHPPGNAVVSELFVKEVYASLIENRPAWEKTLLVITFDEFVGTFDHIAPGWDGTPHSAAPPWGSAPPPELSINPPFDFKRFGGRVPAILVSPWAPKSAVFRSQTDVPYDHTSLIATTLQWLGLEAQLPSFGMRARQAPTFDRRVDA